MWTKSACVVFAWGILLILMAVGMRGSVRPVQANIRIASSTTNVTLTSTLNVAAAPVKATHPGAKYVLQPGDTLSGIATALAVPGGWRALYAANRRAIGADPNVIRPRTVLVLPGQTPSVRYKVAAGKTLSGIAAALAVPGGWRALYAANRRVIGPDPNTIRPGTVLTVSRPAAPASPATVPRRAHPAPPPAPARTRHHAAPARTSAPAPVGVPRWLTTVLMAAGLLIGAVCLAELVLEAGHWRWPLVTRGRRCTREKSRIVLADYGRLVVTQNKADGTVYVLRPPGEDPGAILRVASLVLKEDLYEELAARLGVPADSPRE
jgi:LysM repeat protein